MRPIRYFEHLVFDNIRFGKHFVLARVLPNLNPFNENRSLFTGPSSEVIEDELNMIGFFKEPDDMVLGMADDSDVSLSDYAEEGILTEEDEEEDDEMDDAGNEVLNRNV
jgi:hypothetical protein